jgi:tetratricopeptide (TPR) repeat protein
METYSDLTDVDKLCDQGDAELRAGNLKQAGTHYERALEFGAAQLSLDRRIYVRMALALCFFSSGSYKDVVKYDRATLKILKAELDYGVDHEYTAGTRYRLARALVDSVTKSDRKSSAQWNEAVKLYKENDRVADKDLSLKTRKGLASVYLKLTQYSKAEDIYEQLLDEGEANFLDGEDDESLKLKHEYAAVQYHRKRYKKSKRLFSQIEETILSLPRSRKRKLETLSQDVDQYLAACFEATLDLDRGVARSVAASKQRKDSPPAPFKQSSAEDAPHQSRQSSPAPVRKTSGSKPHVGPNDDAAASMTPKRRTSSNHRENTQKASKDTTPSTGKRSSKTASRPSSAESSKSPPSLKVPSSATLKTRRSNSDHSVTRSREAIKSEVPVTRSRSAHSPSRSKRASDPEPRPKSQTSLRPENREKKSSQSQSRSHASDSESTSKSGASLRSRPKSSASTSRPTHASDSESRSKAAASRRPEKKPSNSPSISSSDSEQIPISVAPLRPEKKRPHATESESELRSKSKAPLRPEKRSSVSKHTSDSEVNQKSVAPPRPKQKSEASLRPEKKLSHSASTPDSESKSQSIAPPHPKQNSPPDSSDSESKPSQSTPRSDSKTKRASDSKTESSQSPKKIILPLDSSLLSRSTSESTTAASSKIKSSRSASESKPPADSKTKSSRSTSTSPSDSESKLSHSSNRPSDSKSRSSRPTPSSSSQSKQKSVASQSSEQNSSKDKPCRKGDLKDNPQSLRASEPRRSRSVSAPSTSGTSSTKSVRATEVPDQPSKRSRAEAQIPDVVISPPSTCRPPGSWPEDLSSLSTESQGSKELAPSKSKNRRRSLDEGTVASLATTSSSPKLERSRSESCASSEAGKLYDMPENAAEADRWFGKLRKHTHGLLYHDGTAAKNPGRRPVRVAILDSGLADNCDDAEVPLARHSRRKVRAGHITYKDFTGDSPSCSDSKENLHGTWCASILMQVAPRAELYVANVVQRKKKGQEAKHVAKAIEWAIEQQVDVISMSFGWNHEMAEVGEQIDLARAKGILLFAAASNDGDFTPRHGVYPASHHLVYCIYSCRGMGNSSEFNPRFTDDAAKFMFPGEDLAILESNNKPVTGSARQSGTSFATPIAAGIAAMILDLARLTLKDSGEVERRLKKVEGMTTIFRAMSPGLRDGGYYHVQPWTLLGEPKPIESLHNPNESHQWFTLMNMLGLLREMFGPYKTPLG